MTWLLDSTALLAFLLDEAEAEAVESLIFDRPGEAAVSFATWVEVHGRLKALGLSEADIRAQMTDARALPLATLWPDERVLQGELEIKAAGYFPFADTLIAATAHANDLTLVHKDPHFAVLPASIRQLNLLQPAAK